MLGMFKKALTDNVKRFSGQKDFLEAVCAASALVAAADGDISDAEVAATIKAVKNNAILAGAYNARQIETTAETMLQRAGGGRMGKMGLMREIEEAASDPDKAEAIVMAALDIAEADGEIQPAEMAVLEKIGAACTVDVKKFL